MVWRTSRIMLSMSTEWFTVHMICSLHKSHTPSHGPLSHRITQPHTLPPTWRSHQHARQPHFQPNEARTENTKRISAKPIMSHACPGNLAATTRVIENDAKRKVLGRLWSLMPMKACMHLLPSPTNRRNCCTRLAGTRHDASAAAGHQSEAPPSRRKLGQACCLKRSISASKSATGVRPRALMRTWAALLPTWSGEIWNPSISHCFNFAKHSVFPS